MNTRTIWIADDGKEFNTEEECVAYENRFDRYEALLRDETEIAFYRHGERITSNRFDIHYNFILYCELMIIKSNEAVEALQKIAERYGLGSMPNRIGVFLCNFNYRFYSERVFPVEKELLKNLSAVSSETLKAMAE